MKIMSVFGTRPEMIKLWPVLRKLDQLDDIEHIMVHTGQNYTPELKDFFFKDLELRDPDYQLSIDTSGYDQEVADVIVQTGRIFDQVKPDALLILGDTYSGLSVLPATHRGIKVFHMEAGLRAYDKRMPEQRNRMLIDRLSDYNFVFHAHHRENLLRENMHPSRIIISGDPTFETIRYFEQKIESSSVLETHGLKSKNYVLVTAHRSENVDNRDTLQSIFDALTTLQQELKLDIIYPMHPRTVQKANYLGLAIPDKIKIIKPLGYYDFNKLFKEAACVLSDSGTSPVEAYFYKVPCVSLRQTTERFETIEGGAHIVAGLEKNNIVAAVKQVLQLGWAGRYDLCNDFNPSTVVINTIRSHITNYF